eukprot:Selendium_serpulae@DN3338_c0_g1_i2.p1
MDTASTLKCCEPTSCGDNQKSRSSIFWQIAIHTSLLAATYVVNQKRQNFYDETQHSNPIQRDASMGCMDTQTACTIACVLKIIDGFQINRDGSDVKNKMATQSG